MKRKKIFNKHKDRKKFTKSIKKTNSLNLGAPVRGGYRI